MSEGNYRILVSYDSEKKTFTARVPELGHCLAEGATRAEALTRAEEEIAAQLANMREQGGRPPAPVDETVCDGNLTVKLSRSLHRELLFLAHSEGIGIDQLAGELIASALESKRSGRGAGRAQPPARVDHAPDGNHDDRGNRIDHRPRGANYGARYHGILEDRANFIEYVRGLDQNNGPSASSGGGGPGGRRRRRRGKGGMPGPRNDGRNEMTPPGGSRGDGSGGGGGAPNGSQGG